MNKNKKKTVVLVEQASNGKASVYPSDNNSRLEKLKKPAIFALMGIVFAGSMYLIFKPSAKKTEIQNIGLNETVPQASDAVLQGDKQKGYEQEILEQKEQEKQSSLTTLSDYWNEDNNAEKEASSDNQIPSNLQKEKPANAALNSYKNTQSTLGSFYQDNDSEARTLRRELEQLKEQLADKNVPKAVTVDDQLALMEKSYQMAAKYLPSTAGAGQSAVIASTLPPSSDKKYFSAFTPARKNAVSALYRKASDSALNSEWNENKSAGSSSQNPLQQKNSVRACIEQTQTITGENDVRLRLLESAKTGSIIVPKGTILTATAKFQTGRLQLKVTSIELDGSIIPVDITVYDLDGQQGLYVPYSAEMSALGEMAGNMSQTTGTSLMLTQSAGQQVAADLSRGVVQGVSGFFSKKIRTIKVTIKAGHELLLVSKK